MAKFAIKIYRYGNYTRAWLNYMCKVYGLEVTEEKEADIILLSISDPTEINLIFEARKGQKPIILGGSEAFHEKMYSNLVDLINVGEGFEIFEKLQLIKDESPGKIIEKLKELPFIYYQGKKGNIYPSTKIDWDLVPIVKTGARRRIILGGRGCKKKCKFCFTSWTTKYQNNSYLPNIDKQVMIITNDNLGPKQLYQRAYVRSITAEGYLKMTKVQAKTCYYYRIGLESFSEKTRKFYGKPISGEQIRRIMEASREFNHRLTLFIIAGYEPQESVEEFCNSFRQDTRYKNPKIEVKMTYLEPTLHTPLQDFDIRKMYHWDKNYLISTLTYASQRFRIWSMKRNCGGAYWRTCLHRARTREEIEEVYRWKGKTGEEILELIEQKGWQHLYNQNNSTGIKFWCEVKR